MTYNWVVQLTIVKCKQDDYRSPTLTRALQLAIGAALASNHVKDSQELVDIVL